MVDPKDPNGFPALSPSTSPADPQDRRLRRRLVETMLLRGEGYAKIVVEVARQLGVSTRTVKRDVKITRGRWLRWETGKGHRRLVLNLQRMDLSIRSLMDAPQKDWPAIALIAYRQARLLGYGGVNVFVDGRTQVVNVNGPGGEGPSRIAVFRRLAASLEGLTPEEIRSAIVNGKGGANGHDGNGA